MGYDVVIQSMLVGPRTCCGGSRGGRGGSTWAGAGAILVLVVGRAWEGSGAVVEALSLALDRWQTCLVVVTTVSCVCWPDGRTSTSGIGSSSCDDGCRN